MANYRLQVYRRYPEKEMRQVVVYLRKTGSPRVFQKKFELTRTRHEFDVIRIWEEPAERFLETPGLLPFAVLARTSDREATLRRVSGQIEAIGDRGQRSDLAVSTAVLAGLVLEKQFIRSVLREDVMKESAIYQDIFATAKEEGRAEGRAEGRTEGIVEGERSLVLRLLELQVGSPLSDDLQQQVLGLSPSLVQALGEALLQFASEADLANWLQKHQ